MPNWVVNILTCMNHTDCTRHILNKKGEVDFNLSVRMPFNLSEESCDSNMPIAIYCYLSDKGRLTADEVASDRSKINIYNACEFGRPLNEAAQRLQDLINENTPESKEMIDQFYNDGSSLAGNFISHSSMTWFDWAVKNWGCKWNASSTKILSEPDEDKLIVQFETPWSAPVAWAKKLCEEKKISFYIEWIEETGYHGEIFTKNGQLITNDLPAVDTDDSDDDYGEYDDEYET